MPISPASHLSYFSWFLPLIYRESKIYIKTFLFLKKPKIIYIPFKIYYKKTKYIEVRGR